MMNKRQVFSILSVLCFVILMLGLARVVMRFSPEAIAADGSTETQPIRPVRNSNPFTTALTATNSMPDINNQVVAVVMQPAQDRIQAFNALTGEWVPLGGNGLKVEADDIVMLSNLVILVAQPGQEQLHAFSALTNKWATLGGSDFRVNSDDIFKVSDSVIIVAQPGQEQLHAFSAFTGEWATLGGSDFSVSPNDVVLVAATQAPQPVESAQPVTASASPTARPSGTPVSTPRPTATHSPTVTTSAP
jgi:Na+-transporting methylmalonyl-CoA/oxaloacetate decarboxylase gamma subunit